MPSLSSMNRPSSAAFTESVARPVLMLPRASSWPTLDPSSPMPKVEEGRVFSTAAQSEVSPFKTYDAPPAPPNTVDIPPPEVLVEETEETEEDEPNYLLWGGLIAGGVTILGTGVYFAMRNK